MLLFPPKSLNIFRLPVNSQNSHIFMRRFLFFFNLMLISNVSAIPFALEAEALSNVNDVKEIGFEEKLGSSIDMNTEFRGENGEPVSISSFFEGAKPVVLSLAYFTCPRLCLLGTDGVSEAINQLNSFRPGNDYTVLTVSFDPEESYEAINSNATRYKKALGGGTQEAEGWHFLTATEENILKLTDSVGFRFKKDGDEFAHASGIVILTPEGVISRYLYGVQYDPRNFKLSLIEASEGKIGSSELLNKVLMFCYQFDPVGKRYALAALNVVKVGGMITLAALVTFLYFMWKREKKFI